MPEIRCVCVDVDGVLTDGRIFMDAEGRSARAFHVHDGFAIRWFQKLGGVVVILSGKQSEAVAARARELGIQHVIQGSADKLADLRALAARLELDLSAIAFVGDDLPDLPPMRACGLPVAVANAVPAVKAVAKFVTARPGGEGALREAIEHVMKRSGRWNEVLEFYGAASTGG
jgi:3-deoxy-D-manno-octulosonate 8-phosphate phosphatase (KDO 8-P phosphatase)